DRAGGAAGRGTARSTLGAEWIEERDLHRGRLRVAEPRHRRRTTVLPRRQPGAADVRLLGLRFAERRLPPPVAEPLPRQRRHLLRRLGRSELPERRRRPHAGRDHDHRRLGLPLDKRGLPPRHRLGAWLPRAIRVTAVAGCALPVAGGQLPVACGALYCAVSRDLSTSTSTPRTSTNFFNSSGEPLSAGKVP